MSWQILDVTRVVRSGIISFLLVSIVFCCKLMHSHVGKEILSKSEGDIASMVQYVVLLNQLGVVSEDSVSS